MKRANKRSCRVIAFFLAVILSMSSGVPVYASKEKEAYIINSEEDFIAFAALCKNDSWSKGKKVVLKKDITLSENFTEPVASFGGIFDGEGHTIDNLNLTGAFSPAGLFGEVQKEGRIQNLNVNGIVMPSGAKEDTGGIAGVNQGRLINCTFTGTVAGEKDTGGIIGSNAASGEIYQCTMYGKVAGKSHTGGIAGVNEGSITGCVNKSLVNTESMDPTLSLDEINLDITANIKNIASISNLEYINVATDTGGIAGYSTGIIGSSSNEGTVGYLHIGYNVGGIAGRTCGFLSNCINNGTIYGRKDVGGISGQSEPYFSLNLSEDNLNKLRKELSSLDSLVSDAADSIDSSSDVLNTSFNKIGDYIDTAMDSVKELENQASDSADDIISQVNNTGAITSDVLIRLETITDKTTSLSNTISDGLVKLSEGFSGLSDAVGMGSEALNELKLSVEQAKDAVTDAKEAAVSINDGITSLRNAVKIKDKTAAKNALKQISDGLNRATESLHRFSSQVRELCEILRDNGWMTEAAAELSEFAGEIESIGKELVKIHEAVDAIDENIEIDWDKIDTGSDEILKALDAFSDAAEAVNHALESAESGVSKIQDGIAMLADAVKVEDEAKVTKALNEIYDGILDLSDAFNKISMAMQKLSDALQGVKDWSGLKSHLDEIAEAAGEIAAASGDAAAALSKIAEGIKIISENVSIDPDKVDNGAELVIDGFEDISECIKTLEEANEKLADGMDLLKDGLSNLKDGITIDDKEAIRAALEQIHEASGEIASTISEVGTTLAKAADTLHKMQLWGDSVTEKVSQIADTFSDLSGAMTEISQGVAKLKDAAEIDLNSAEEGLSKIQTGIKELVSSAANLESSFSSLADSLNSLQGASKKAQDSIAVIADAVDIFKEAFDELAQISNDCNELFRYLSGVDPVHVTNNTEKINASADKLYAAGTGISGQLSELNEEIHSISGDIADKIRKINAQFMVIANLLIDSIYEVEDASAQDIVSDTSEVDIDSVMYGKLYFCTNNGPVSADINAGGITGSMAIEYELDPEDDITNSSSSLNKIYETKAIIQKAVNYGKVTARNNCAACICGKMDLGLIIQSEAYGSAQSENGDNVGGIAGISSSKIKDSWAKCTLSGRNYVGGIIGTGTSNELTGSDCNVTGCRSMVQIAAYVQFAGAIAGNKTGTFKDNFFVSDTLSGIDRINYEGCASQISYQELTSQSNVPDDFKKLTLTFVNEDKIIKSIVFHYGDSFDASVYPDVPEKEGYYCNWDKDNLKELHLDTIVNAEYNLYQTTIFSEQRRKDERAVFLAEGLFTKKDSLAAEQLLPEASDMIERWKISFPEDKNPTHTIRFLPEDKNTESAVIYVKRDGVWEKTEHTVVGSYLSFKVSGTEAEIAVKKTEHKSPMITAAAGILGALLLLLIITKHRKKKGKTK